MIYKIMEYINGEMLTRDATAEETAEIEARKPVVYVPQTVSRRQGRQALLLGGYLDKVQPIIDSLSDPLQKGMTQIWWEDADSFDRNNQTVVTLGTALGLTSADLDNLFIQAAQL